MMCTGAKTTSLFRTHADTTYFYLIYPLYDELVLEQFRYNRLLLRHIDVPKTE